MFSNTTPRPLLCEQAGLGHSAKKTVLKDAQLQAGFPQRPFSLSASWVLPVRGCAPAYKQVLTGTDTKLLPSLRGFTGEKNL